METYYPIENEKGMLIAAKVIVYAGDHEQNYSFITSEAYIALKTGCNVVLHVERKIRRQLGYARFMEDDQYAIWLKIRISNTSS